MKTKAILLIAIAIFAGAGMLALVMRGWGTATISIQDVPASGTVIDMDDYFNFGAATYSEVFQCIDSNTYEAYGNVTYTVRGPFEFCGFSSPTNWYRTDFVKDDIRSYYGPYTEGNAGDENLAFYLSDWVTETSDSPNRSVRWATGSFLSYYTTTLDSNNPPVAGKANIRNKVDTGAEGIDFPYIFATRYHTVPNATVYYSYNQQYDWDVGWGNDFCSTDEVNQTADWSIQMAWMGWRCYGPYCGNVVRLRHTETSGGVDGWDVVERWYLMENRGLVYIDQWVDYMPGVSDVQCTIVNPCTLAGDTDCDCDVDIMDVIRVVVKQGCSPPDACYDADCDFDSDSDIDSDDLAYVKARRGNNCS